MAQRPNRNGDPKDKDATSEQFTALLLRYLARRAEQAQRRARVSNDETETEGVAVAADQAERDDIDIEDDESHSPDTDNEENAWGTFFRSKRKKKSIPKLDLVDENNNFDYFDDHKQSLGRLKQWIDDGQFANAKEAQQHFDATETMTHSHVHKPLICNNKRHGSSHAFIPYNFHHFLQLRELGAYGTYSPHCRGVISRCTDYLFSNNVSERFEGNSRVFCSSFSADGNVLCVASQDHVIHLIDSSSGMNSNKWPIYKQVESQFSGWSIIDVALSPDHEFVAYSGWSSSIYLVNTYGSHELHESHDLNISTFNSWGRCCIFGIEFDPNSKKVICALSGGCLILHDLERKLNQFSLPNAHDDDINQATFLDANTIISGSDDALLRVWDARQDGYNKCVGGFVGHYQGITCVSTPNDYGSSCYVLSNSKDQSLKIWDLRSMNSLSELTSTRAQLQPSTGSFDYRYRGWNPRSSSTHQKRFRIDKSLVTYRGHSVSRTLCRSAFSPIHCTSAKYVYCGSSDCGIYIYNTLDAKLHCTLQGHSDIVRDVCWHPYLPIIVSASWDGSVVRWSYRGSNKEGSIKGKPKKRKIILCLDEDADIDADADEYSDSYNDNGSDSDSDSEDNEAYEMPTVALDMPEHLRKRNDYDYW